MTDSEAGCDVCESNLTYWSCTEIMLNEEDMTERRGVSWILRSVTLPCHRLTF